jgi:hypothetical protein
MPASWPGWIEYGVNTWISCGLQLQADSIGRMVLLPRDNACGALQVGVKRAIV